MNYLYNGRYNYTRTNLLTAPTTEPVTLAEVKTYLGITDANSDAALNSWIEAVRQAIELYLGIAIMSQTWQQFFDIFPFYSGILVRYPYVLEIPKAPLTSVTHIKFYDVDDVATTIASTEYQVAKYSATNPWNGRIAFKDTFSAPSLSDLRNIDSTEIEFVAGYATQAEVPEAIKTAIMQEIAFRNNIKVSGDIDGESVTGVYSVKYGSNNNVSSAGLSDSTKSLLQIFRKVRI